MGEITANFLPGSVGIKLVDRMGTLGLFKDYGYAVQELVTRTFKVQKCVLKPSHRWQITLLLGHTSAQ